MNQYQEAWKRVQEKLKDKTSWGNKQVIELMNNTLMEVQSEMLNNIPIESTEVIRNN